MSEAPEYDYDGLPPGETANPDGAPGGQDRWPCPRCGAETGNLPRHIHGPDCDPDGGDS